MARHHYPLYPGDHHPYEHLRYDNRRNYHHYDRPMHIPPIDPPIPGPLDRAMLYGRHYDRPVVTPRMHIEPLVKKDRDTFGYRKYFEHEDVQKESQKKSSLDNHPYYLPRSKLDPSSKNYDMPLQKVDRRPQDHQQDRPIGSNQPKQSQNSPQKVDADGRKNDKKGEEQKLKIEGERPELAKDRKQPDTDRNRDNPYYYNRNVYRDDRQQYHIKHMERPEHRPERERPKLDHLPQHKLHEKPIYDHQRHDELYRPGAHYKPEPYQYRGPPFGKPNRNLKPKEETNFDRATNQDTADMYGLKDQNQDKGVHPDYRNPKPVKQREYYNAGRFRPQNFGPRPHDFGPRPQDFGPRPQDFRPKPQDFGPRPPNRDRDRYVPPHPLGERYNHQPHHHGQKYYNPVPNHQFGGGERHHEHQYDYQKHGPEKEYYPYKQPGDRAERDRNGRYKEYRRAKSQESNIKSDIVNYSASKSPARRYFKFEDEAKSNEKKGPEKRVEHVDMFKQHYKPDHVRQEGQPRYYDQNRNQYRYQPKSDKSGPKEEDKAQDEHHERRDRHTREIEHKTDSDTESKECATIAKYMHTYAELESNEKAALNTLLQQPNFNIFNAFELLKPNLGIVTAGSLFQALKDNLGINIEDRTIVDDLIQRLAYVSDNSLLISDMKFFEPARGTAYYDTYKASISRKQDPNDKTWHAQFKLLWEAMIETILKRRQIQADMVKNHDKAITFMYSNCKVDRNHKFNEEELEAFVNNNHNSTISRDNVKHLLNALDRDQDGLVSYLEFNDAFFGAE